MLFQRNRSVLHHWRTQQAAGMKWNCVCRFQKNGHCDPTIWNRKMQNVDLPLERMCPKVKMRKAFLIRLWLMRKHISYTNERGELKTTHYHEHQMCWPHYLHWRRVRAWFKCSALYLKKQKGSLGLSRSSKVGIPSKASGTDLIYFFTARNKEIDWNLTKAWKPFFCLAMIVYMTQK